MTYPPGTFNSAQSAFDYLDSLPAGTPAPADFFERALRELPAVGPAGSSSVFYGGYNTAISPSGTTVGNVVDGLTQGNVGTLISQTEVGIFAGALNDADSVYRDKLVLTLTNENVLGVGTIEELFSGNAPVWDAASLNYANAASGNILAVFPEGLDPEASIFTTTELDALINSGKVNTINGIEVSRLASLDDTARLSLLREGMGEQITRMASLSAAAGDLDRANYLNIVDSGTTTDFDPRTNSDFFIDDTKWSDLQSGRMISLGSGSNTINLAPPDLNVKVLGILDKLDGGIVGTAAIGLLLMGVANQADAALTDEYGPNYNTANVLEFVANSNLPISPELLTSIAQGALQDVLLKGAASLLGVGLLWTAFDVYQNIDGLTEAMDFAAQGAAPGSALSELNNTVQGVKQWLQDRFGNDADYVPQHAELAALIESQFDYETQVSIGSAIKSYLAEFGVTPGLLREDVAGWMAELQALVDVISLDLDSGVTSLEDALQAALYKSDLLTIQQKIAIDPTRCFPAGTQISLWDGSSKSIEDIAVSDVVLCFDNAGQPQPGYVTRLFRNLTTEWVRLDFVDRRETIHVTPGHRFLTETGDYMEIGHMLRLGGGVARVVMSDGSLQTVRGCAIEFGKETAGLFETVGLQKAAGTPDLLIRQGWQTYNFEVRAHHNYVANDVRVHNDSIFAFLQPHEYSQVTEVRDTNNDSFPDYVLLKEPGVATEREKYLDGVNAVEEITTSDGRGNIIYQRVVKDTDGNVIERGEPQYLSGQFIGESIGSALTPFLTNALLGDGLNAFENIAANTVLGTTLENVSGVIGALIDRGFITNYGEVSIAGHFDTIAGGVFEDFGGELIVNGINNVTSTINQLVMAEIFEFIDADGVPGAVYEAVIGAGVSNVVSFGVDWFVDTELFESFFSPGSELYQEINESIRVTSLPDAILPTYDDAGNVVSSGWASLVLGAVVREILPPLETTEGQIASAITGAVLYTSTALSSMLLNLGAFAGPVGAVITWAIGAIVDALFDKDPQAWTSVGFDADTGRFVLTGTWSDDGGDTELSQALAQAYVNGMNGFVDTMMSQSHNYGALAQWSFGHYEESLKNAGSNGQTFANFQNTYLDAYIRDLANVNLQDGQMTAVRALNNLNLDILIDRKIATPSDETRIFSEVLNDDGVTTSVVEGVVEGALRQITIEGGATHAYDGRNPVQIYQMVAAALQIAEDYHTYLENTEAINALMVASPDSAFAAGWYTTLLEAERLGLTDSYDLTGSAIDNVFYTGEGNDSVLGGAGDDLIKTYLGDDTLSGDEGNDTLHAGAGTDQVSGGSGDDSLEGGDGADVIDGGSGTDWATFATSGAGVTVDLFAGVGLAGEAAGDTYVNIENLRGSLHEDELKGDAFANVVEAGAGQDTVFGHGGNDTVYGQDGNDMLYGDLAEDISVVGDDTLYGDAGNDTLHGGEGVDRFDGGADFDVVSYRHSTVGTVASLTTNLAKIHGDIEYFTSIEGLIGSAHSDILVGNSGVNTLEGLKGNDTLKGGEGGDTYRYSFGDGNDRISDFHNGVSVDRLIFTDLNVDDVSFASDSDEDLVITMSNGERISVADHFSENTNYAIEQIEFADGTVLNLQGIRDKSVFDQKVTGGGTVRGSDLSEVYTHSLGDGSYRISDFDNDSRVDRLLFLDVNPEDVSFASSSGENLIITLANGERISVIDHFAESGSYAIEQIEFADGTILDEAGIRNKSVADQKSGGTGTVIGSDLSETYVHALGDGSYRISDFDNNDRVDRLVFTDVNSTDVVLSSDGDNLRIIVMGVETVTIAGQLDSSKSYHIETIEFADGVIYSPSDLPALLVDPAAVPGNQIGQETTNNYVHTAGDGSYTIKDYDYLSNNGTDTLTFSDVASSDVSLGRIGSSLVFTLNNGEEITVLGQLGRTHYNAIESVSFADGVTLNQDQLRDRLVSDMKDAGRVIGTENSENYTHTSGDGSYTISDYDYLKNDGVDTLTFTDVTADDVTLSRVGNNVIFTLSKGEQVTILDQLIHDRWWSVETVSFSDGTTWNEQALRDRLVADMKSAGTVVGSELSEGYVHASGDGSYTISDYDYLNNDGTDTLTFLDVTSTEVTFGRTVADVVIKLQNGEQITLLNQFHDDQWHRMESISFADGVTLNLQGIRDRAVADMKQTGIVIGSELVENYTFTLGDGSHYISDYDYLKNGGDDRLIFTDVNASDVTFWQGLNFDLNMRFSTGEAITISQQFDVKQYKAIEQFVFADGTTLDKQAIRNKSVADMKPLGLVLGSEQTENFFHTLGDGTYRIRDYDYLNNNGSDTLTLTDTTAADVTFSHDGDYDLLITFANGEVVTITDQFVNDRRHALQEITFADGTTIDEQGIRDKSSADMKSTGFVRGSELTDNYFHALGDGSYRISDYDYLNNEGFDTLTLTDVNASDVSFANTGGYDLTVTFANGETITVTDHFVNDRRHAIQEITFADGSALSEQGIRNKSAADMKDTGFVRGSELTENFFHSFGDGSYRITDYDYLNNEGFDTLTLTDVNPGDVTFLHNGDLDLVITFSNGETITVTDHFLNNRRYALQQINFADGTSLDEQGIRNKSAADMKATGFVRGSELTENFYHNMGDGSYQILDYDYLNNEGYDTLTFLDVNSDQVMITQDSDLDMILRLDNGEVITVTDHFNSNNRYALQAVTFADGVTLNQQELIDRSLADAQRARDLAVAEQKASGAVVGTEEVENYFHALGDGSYTITESSATNHDRLTFTDLNVDDVTFANTLDDDLVITMSNGETVTIVNHFLDYASDMAYIEFADGTVLGSQAQRDKAAADQKASGAILGSNKVENYFHALGDGSYTITEQSTDAHDRLTFTDLNASEVTFKATADDDLIIAMSNGETVTIVDHFLDYASDVRYIEFSDGTVLESQAQRDKAASDQKASGAVQGTNKFENYIHTLGDGSYTIAEKSANSNDLLTFVDINPDQADFGRNAADDLVITLSNGETVTVLGHFAGGDTDISSIAFADATVMGLADIEIKMNDDSYAALFSDVDTVLLVGSMDSVQVANGLNGMTDADGIFNVGLVTQGTDVDLSLVAWDIDYDYEIEVFLNNEYHSSLAVGVNGAFSVHTVSFDAAQLNDGNNVITFKNHDATWNWGLDDLAAVDPNTGVPAISRNDLFVGTGGSDKFYSDTQRGHDQIKTTTSNYQEVDRLYFGAGITVADLYSVNAHVGGGGDYDMTIHYRNANASITILDYGNNGSSSQKYHINEFIFADGTVMGRNAFMRATLGTDGNDHFDGTGESDDFVFDINQGDDTIGESVSNYQEVDRLFFGAGITVDDLYSLNSHVGGSSAYDLTIRVKDQDGSITILDYGDNSSSSQKYHINQFVFADGTVLNRNAFMRETMGTDGNDHFDGTGESDDFVFDINQGDDTIGEAVSNYQEVDRIVFGEGITVSDVYTVSDYTGGALSNLRIAVTGEAGSITINNYGNNASSSQKYHINQFVFSDGTVLSRNSFMLQTMGTSGDDMFDGTGESDDYKFNLGEGHDSILEWSSNYQEVDRLVFDSDAAVADVFSFRDDVDDNGTDDLVIGVTGYEGSSMTILNAYNGSDKYRVALFEFSDGTVLDYDNFVLATLDQSQETGFFV
ncbi:calcium-binding protein [Roseobacter sp. MH60115]|uniref:calcium-binding protein n=1 Tax=Roseobacter sp. MH60115 TaxID=2785324 RepID=UPI0018A2B763|nr:calcium-binding protein [Roseobacter sp. MH60115]